MRNYDLTKKGIVTVAPFKVEMRDDSTDPWQEMYFLGNDGTECKCYMGFIYDESGEEVAYFHYYSECRHCPEKVAVPFCLDDFAKLPFGTQYVINKNGESCIYVNPTITLQEDIIYINGLLVYNYIGYTLPGETEIKKFQTERAV